MKKLLFGLLLLISTPAFAGQIILSQTSADATVDGLNNNWTSIQNLFNGQVEGSTDGGSTVSNIKADSVFEINMADDANGRVRDAELFNITVDTISGGAISSQGTVVESGCVQATSAGLTADVSACVVYINGYRVSKGATSETYSNNTTSYLWLSQTGVYTISTNPDSTIPNSSLLAKVVTSGGAITTVTNLFTTRVSGLIIPANYRSGFIVSRDSTTTVTVFPGSIEINNSILAKTATTTLTISTAGDWAGGSSLRAADTFAFVGMDTSGNIKMHTTAPTNADYAVSLTAGKKRYATWSSTVYRILGWFYMDGAQLVEIASNIKDGDVPNCVVSNDTASVANASTTLVNVSKVNFYNSGGNVLLMGIVSGDSTGAMDRFNMEFARGGTLIGGGSSGSYIQGASQSASVDSTYLDVNRPQATTNYTIQHRVVANGINMQRRSLVVQEQ